MRGLCALVVGLFLSVSVAAPATAAPSTTPAKPQAKQGVINSKKAMQSKRDRDAKVKEARVKGQAMRRQAQAH